MTYILNTPPLGPTAAADLGRTLRLYAVELASVQVWHIYRNGSRHLAQPLAETISQVAGLSGAGASLGCALGLLLAPLAAPLLAALSGPHLIAALGAWLRAVRGLHRTNRDLPHPQAVTSEIHLTLANVSPQRRAWVEYLLGAYCSATGWQLHRPSRSALAGARAGQLPTPWRSQ